MDSDDKLGLVILGGCTLVVVALIGGIVGQGLALSILWRWFITPIFGLPVLTMAQAYGIALVFCALRGYREPAQTDKDAKTSVATGVWKLLIIIVVHPGILVGIGWIVKSLL